MVDTDKHILLGSDYLPADPMPMRILVSSKSRAVQLYLPEVKTKIDDHKIVSKINKLISSWNSLSCSDHSAALDSVDN